MTRTDQMHGKLRRRWRKRRRKRRQRRTRRRMRRVGTSRSFGGHVAEIEATAAASDARAARGARDRRWMVGAGVAAAAIGALYLGSR